MYKRYKEIESQAKITLNLFLKYLIIHKNEIIHRIIEILTVLFSDEKRVMEKVIAILYA